MLQIKRRYDLHTPTHTNTHQHTPTHTPTHTAHPQFSSLVVYTALHGVAPELLRLCCSILPVWSAVSACGGACVLQFDWCILPVAGAAVAAHLRRVLWASAMSLFALSRLLLLCGCVFFALFNLTAYHLLVLRRKLCTPCRGTSLQQSGILTTGETNSFNNTYSQASLIHVQRSSTPVCLRA